MKLHIKIIICILILSSSSITCKYDRNNPNDTDQLPGIEKPNPDLKITNQTGSTVLSGEIDITVTGVDGLEISMVEFYIDNSLVHTDSTQPFEFKWNSSTELNGSHTIKLKVYDMNTTNIFEDEEEIKTDNSLPLVNISSPSNGATVTGIVNINAVADDNDEIDRVEFYIDDILVFTDTSSPYSYVWDTLANTNGSYSLKAIVYDKALNSNEDDNTAVTVENLISHQSYLKAPNNMDTYWFGFATAISGDTLVVGAPQEKSTTHEIIHGSDLSATNNDGMYLGAAYIL